MEYQYQIPQLNSYFEKDLFGIEFDYDPYVTSNQKDQALSLKRDLITQTEINNSVDINPQEDNIIALIGHESKNFNSAIFGIKQVKRTESIGYGETIIWESPMPFIKIIHNYLLPTGENVILGFDILGIALKVNDSSFDPTHYQLGYANLPLDLISLLSGLGTANGVFIPDGISEEIDENSTYDMQIEIEESENNLKVDFIYSNLTFLFQTEKIDFFDVDLAEHVILAQFDELRFSINIRKYVQHGNAGIETMIEITIGNVINLIIDETLPDGPNWENALNYSVQKEFPGIFYIDETFSWYQGTDIHTRISLFSDIAFSVITAQHIGIVNGTESSDNIAMFVDNKNQTREGLLKSDFSVEKEISCFFNDELLLTSQVQGRDFAIQSIGTEDELTLTSVKSKAFAINKHYGFAHNNLFLHETSLLRDIVADCIRRFVNDPIVSSLSADNIYNLAGLYLPSAYYIQEFEVKEWTASKMNLNLLQFAVQTSFLSGNLNNRGNITNTDAFSGFFGLICLYILMKRQKKKQILQ